MDVAYWCRAFVTLWYTCDLEVAYWCRAFGTLWYSGDIEVAYWCRACGTLWHTGDTEVAYWCRGFGTLWHSGDLEAVHWWPTLFRVSSTEDKVIAELMFLCIILYRATKTQGDREVWFHAFLPWQFMNFSCQFHAPALLSQYIANNALVISYINIITNSSNIFCMLL
jgi:hypothetical protein